ncbi:unnamed protein product [Meloidogyne enterolobii]|uniref:Uncharacterized protein n=1 Tax=Meloidogyne enterolobii TaxID=390850 RepID=A0ACB0XYV3_MELEN
MGHKNKLGHNTKHTIMGDWKGKERLSSQTTASSVLLHLLSSAHIISPSLVNTLETTASSSSTCSCTTHIDRPRATSRLRTSATTYLWTATSRLRTSATTYLRTTKI